jgi:phenylpropionate dioxygenase-like ring-hydroxylating dioxygenase large terminal subunit
MDGPASLDRMLNELDSSICEVDAAETLPPAFYTSPLFFEFEKEALFRREWLCVGRESWIQKPGDYFTTSHIGEPIVVVRSGAGEVIAMSSVCQHKAMFVAEGSGNARTFVCPYHHWTYSLEGQLVHAPEMERARNFDKKCIHLARFKVEVWLGFIFITFDSDAAPLAPRLSVLTAELENFEIATLVGPAPATAIKSTWNWKIIIENSNDGYHANRLHHGPLHDLVPSDRCSFPELPADAAGYFRYNGSTHKDVGFNPTQHALFDVFPKLTEAERNRALFSIVPPSLILFTLSDMVFYSIVRAEAVDLVYQDTGILVAPGSMRNALFKERFDMFIRTSQEVVAQDRHVDALVHVGLQSRYAVRGRYSWQEETQRVFNNWLVRCYRARRDAFKAIGR